MKISKILEWLVGAAVILAIIYFFPWRNILWGSMTMSPERTITVMGSAESQVNNQIANFSAGVQAINDNRDVAVKEVNTKVAAITQSVKDFGIEEADIQTQSMSVYQQQDTIYESVAAKSRLGQWNVNNTIQITLRDVTKASALADLLTKSGATNVYGPNFQLDRSEKAADELTELAIADARKKAEVMASASGARLGRVVSVVEGAANSGGLYPFLKSAADGMGGGAPVEPGSTTVSKNVTVVWSIE